MKVSVTSTFMRNLGPMMGYSNVILLSDGQVLEVFMNTVTVYPDFETFDVYDKTDMIDLDKVKTFEA